MDSLDTRYGQNRLLAALPAAEVDLFRKELQLVSLELGQALYTAGRDQTHLYFPLNAIVSLLYVLESGASGEIGIVGNEGLVGVAMFMGGASMASEAVVQSAGHAFRLDADTVRDVFHRAGPVQQLFLRYTQALIAQMGQTAVCNRHHRVEQQLCRWLLMSMDRLQGDELVMTQELIANMLGVRREGVTEAAGKLQQSGIIEYRRGHIKVLDRPRLEEACCECYDVVTQEYRRLLPWEDGKTTDVKSA